MNAPSNLAELMTPQEWLQLRQDIADFRAWRRAEFITAYGTRIPIQFSKENAVVDLRAITPTGEQVQPVIPTQSGNAGKFLQTDGAELSFVGIAGARLILTSDEPVATGGSGEFLAWDTASYDYGSYFSAGAPTRITIRTAGVYQFFGSIAWALNGTGERYLYILKNGTDTIGSTQRPAVSGGRTVNQTFAIGSFVAGDYFEAQAYQTSGGNLNVLAESQTFFTVTRLR